jgi:hypothetical protein
MQSFSSANRKVVDLSKNQSWLTKVLNKGKATQQKTLKEQLEANVAWSDSEEEMVDHYEFEAQEDKDHAMF